MTSQRIGRLGLQLALAFVGVAIMAVGLAIVDELVRGHHSTMVITSKPERGTQVTITLSADDRLKDAG